MAQPENLCHLLPESVPSGLQVAEFQGCEYCAGAMASAEGRAGGAGARIDAWPAVRDLFLAPNPTAGGTALSFALARSGPLRVVVYDMAGRRVRQLHSSPVQAGRQVVPWDGRDESGAPVACGVYVVRVQAPGAAQARRVTVLR